MADPYYPTLVERELARRRKVTRPLFLTLLALIVFLFVVLIIAIVGAVSILRETTPSYADPEEHFKYGSIGAEPTSGIPKKLWLALPYLFKDSFQGRKDYEAFGFLYEEKNGEREQLPIGIAQRRYRGVDLVWFNCATCHVGTVRESEGAARRIGAGMPSNNLRLETFISFILSAAYSEKLSGDAVFEAIRESGQRLGPLEKLYWRFLVLPRLRT